MDTNDVIGSVGVGLILLTFALSTFRLLDSKSSLYYLLNAVGAALACVASYLIDYWPFVILEATWTLVSLVGLFRVTAHKEPVVD